MNKVACYQCEKILFETESIRPVEIGIECQQKGYVYKNACLFSDKYTSIFFCDKECAKMFYEKHIPKTDKNKSIQQALEETRKDIPQMAKECSEGLANLCKLLKIR